MPQLVLASTSPYRRSLLERLDLPFQVAKPDTDETAKPGEAPAALARRLAEAKARAVAADFPQALIIGSDQVAELDGQPIGKPHTHAGAVAQLRRQSGRIVTFHTGLCLYNAATDHAQVQVVPYAVCFRPLDDAQIERYLLREQPYDCAGAAKAEGLGIALLAWQRGEDPNALIGLPLIALVNMLAQAGVAVP